MASEAGVGAAGGAAAAVDTVSEEVAHNFDLDYELQMGIPGPLALQKYRSRRSGMTAYFVDMNTQVINGYFCFGTDQPEAIGIEQLLHQLDSSGGLLPRAMRSDMLRPAWQFHGAENPLADRDESCYVCCALGESAFLGTFSCSLYLLQNLEAVLELHGYPYPHMAKDLAKPVAEEGKPTGDGEGPGVGEGLDPSLVPRATTYDEKEEEGPDVEPQLDAPYYCLSEAGEGAMAWEATLQSMFPGVKSFWNRLLNDGRSHRLGERMRKCYDSMYRPENLSVIITGAIENREQILEMLSDHEMDFYETHPNLPPFVKPWSCPLPPKPTPVSNTVRFVSRNPMRAPTATICVGWRGCPSVEVETAMALKILTAHIAVGPLWTKLVTAGYAHRISWCQLEYMETSSLITIHALPDSATVDKSMEIFKDTLKELAASDPNGNGGLNLSEIQRMADRVGWHYIRETESDPFLVVAAAIAKAERYGEGSQEQVNRRICPRKIVEDLLQKPKQFWIDLLINYFIQDGFYSTQVVPVDEEKENELRQEEQKSFQERPASEMQYAEGSRRAASKPRRKSGNAVGEESNVAVDEDGRNNNLLGAANNEEKKEEGAVGSVSSTEGPLEEQLKQRPFPFGQHDAELENFEQRMEVTKQFLKNVRDSTLKYWEVSSYHTGSDRQHPKFPLNDMPMFTFLDDTQSAFVYVTIALDTTGLDANSRRLLAPVTAALGAFVCPRPPALDTDAEIAQPNEFNPPLYIADSQVSLGLNGESTQNLFLTTIVRPEKYKWAVGLLHHILYDAVFSSNYLRFIAKEAVRGLAANYKMQKADAPNYECFDSGEINLHGLISLIYKQESNARLFVGRRRLDLMMEYLADLEKDPEALSKQTNEAWRKIVDGKQVILQIAGNVTELSGQYEDLVGPWKSIFSGKQKSLCRSDVQLTPEPEVMLTPSGKGIVIELSEYRPPCLSLAIPINPNSADFPKLCIAAQMFSMAQKWIWSCWGLDDVSSPVLRMPCSYANLITLNLECLDVMGGLMAMKMMIKDDWPWLETMLTATKLMVINDPATLELGAQGSIMSALLSHINEQTVECRRNLLKDSMNVTLADIKEVINKHLVKLFDPSSSWCSLMIYKPENEALIARVEQLGYQLTSKPVNELCKNI